MLPQMSPSDMLAARSQLSICDLLQPDVKAQVQQRQANQKYAHEKKTQEMYMQKYDYSRKWIHAVIDRCTGLVFYKACLDNGQIVKRYMVD